MANAVSDSGTDAVMLSGETAAGQFPVETVEAMARIIIGAERSPKIHQSHHRLHQQFDAMDDGIAMAVMYTENHLEGVKVIISLTETGKTLLWMSLISSSLPIFAFTTQQDAENRMSMFRGGVPVTFNTLIVPPEEMNQAVVDELNRRGVVALGDLVILSKGDYVNVHGGTNTMKIVRVGYVIA